MRVFRHPHLSKYGVQSVSSGCCSHVQMRRLKFVYYEGNDAAHDGMALLLNIDEISSRTLSQKSNRPEADHHDARASPLW